jgi:perosamine synthetase
MPVHWGGLPADLDALQALADTHNLTVIEDAAHALGATYRGAPIGARSAFTCFSFQAIKHLTTGDGGALCMLTAEHERAAKARRWFGIDRQNAAPSPLGERRYDISELGFKYHLNDYAAALGLANLRTFGERLAARRRIAARYREALAGVPGLTLLDAPADRESAHWLFGVRVERRDAFIAAMQAAEVPVSVVHQGIDRNSIFGGTQAGLVNQRRFDLEQIHLPIHHRIGEEEADYIIGVIRKGW